MPNDPAAQAHLVVIQNNRLPRRHRPLIALERQTQGVQRRAGCLFVGETIGVLLSVARLGRESLVFALPHEVGTLATHPTQILGHQLTTEQGRVVMPLHRHQGIAHQVFARHKPRFVVAFL